MGKRAQRQKPALKSVKPNPFELRYTKQKHDVLGRKVKGVVGKPGVSRSRATQIRNDVLLEEWKKGSRTTKFIDKRIGERNSDMSAEDKLLERFVLEKQRSFARESKASRKAASDLNDSQIQLTHYGQSLSDTRFDSEVNLYGDDSDLDDDSRGKIDEATVATTHFGGFESDADGQEKSRKQVMQEVMAKAKLYKYQRQKAREENDDLRRAMDEDLSSVFTLLKEYEQQKKLRAVDVPKEDIPNDDSYDKLMREMTFDKRARPTDKMQTETELLSKEVERLSTLGNDGSVKAVFSYPKQAADLLRELAVHVDNMKDMATAFGRMRVHFHPKLSRENFENFEKFILIVWDSISKVFETRAFTTLQQKFDYIDLATRHLADFTREYPQQMSRIVGDYLGAQDAKQSPSFAKLVYYQIVLFLYPALDATECTSESYHPLTSKVQEQVGLLLGTQLQRVQTALELSPRLVLDSIALLQLWSFGQNSLSLVFSPEAFNLLNYLLFCFVSPPVGAKLSFPFSRSLQSWSPPLKLTATENLLEMSLGEGDCLPVDFIMATPDALDEAFKQSALFLVLKLSERLLLCTKHTLASFPELFANTTNFLELLPKTLPEFLSSRATRLVKSIALASSSVLSARKRLQLQKFKPVPISTFTPLFDEQYSLDRHKASYGKTREQLEGEKLKQALKREKQGALRELRKDTAFLHRQQLAKLRKSDQAYNEKISKIVGQLGDQEGEGKKLDRLKKRIKSRK